MAYNLFREPANAAPMAWFTGTEDKSAKVVPAAEPARSIHLPFYFVYAEKGDTIPQLVHGPELMNHYGSKLLDSRSKWATPAFPFIERMQKNSNMMMIQRLVPADIQDIETAKARVTLCLDLEEVAELPQYERTPTGTFVRSNVPGQEGKLVETGETLKGYRAQWVFVKKETADDLEVAPVVGKANTTRYPILELTTPWFGSYGNNLGIRLSAPTSKDRSPINENLVKDQQTYLFRAEFIEREHSLSTPTTIRTNDGESTVNFSFKPNSYNSKLGNTDLYIGTMLLDQYRNLAPPAGRRPKYGPFNELEVYTDNVETVLTKIFDEEIKVNTELQLLATDSMTQEVRGADEAMYLINFLTGVDTKNRPYYTFLVEDSVTAFTESEGSMKVALGKDNSVFAMGGKDGEMGPQNYDKDVRLALKAIASDNADWKIEDMAQYPFRNFYDVGFSRETKDEAFILVAKRPDVNVCMSPRDVITPCTKAEYDAANSLSGVRALLADLNSTAANYPESVIYGTSVTRVVIPTQTGELIDSTWKKRVPTTIEIQEMRSRYMGQNTGVFRNGYGYDESPNNVVSILKNIDHLAVFGDTRENLWANNAVWFQNKRHNTPFCPAVQTAFPDDTSVLNSDINMQIICEINYICFLVWTELTGNTRLSDEQLVARSDKMIADFTRGVFDDRVTIIPATELTERDKLRGWSWTCRVKVEFPTMRTVSQNTVVAHRIGEAE